MKALFTDLCLAGRLLRRDAWHSLAAVLALAVGAGAAAAVFSLAAGVLFRPLPYDEAHQLVWVEGKSPRTGRTMTVPLKDLGGLRSSCSSFSEMAALLSSRATFFEGRGAEALRVMLVTSGFSSMHRHSALIGRTLSKDDFRPEGPSAAMLSHAFWQKHFGGKADIIGKTLSIRADYPGRITESPAVLTVVGVMRESFPLGRIPGSPSNSPTVDVWIPVDFGNNISGGRYAPAIARLREGASLQQAQDELKQVAEELAAAKSQDYDREVLRSLRLVPLHERVVGQAAAQILPLLMGASLLLLAACCANVVSLFLSRAGRRSGELALRGALGARKAQLVRCLVGESLLISAAAGILGSLLAWAGMDLLAAFGPREIPRLEEIRFDGWSFALAIATTLLCGVACAAVPALRVSRLGSARLLQLHSSTATVQSGRLAKGLVVAEIALSLVILISAGLLTRSMGRLLAVDPGFDPERVLLFSVSFEGDAGPGGLEELERKQQLLERLRSLPGALSAAAGAPPLRDKHRGSYLTEGQEDPVPVSYNPVSSDYFRLLGIRMLSGRPFSDRDSQESQRVGIVSRMLAGQLWPGQDPLGKRIREAGAEDSEEGWVSIVGVADEVRRSGLDIDPVAELYLPFRQSVGSNSYFLVKTHSEPLSMLAAIKQAVWSIERDQVVTNAADLQALLDESLSLRRFMMGLSGVLSGLALLIAVSGLYGVLSSYLSARTRELAVRMALGARTGNIARFIIRLAMGLLLSGLALGLLGAMGLTNLLASQLYGVSTADPATFAAVSLLLAAVTLLCCMVPVIRAIRIDPVSALKYE